VTISAILLSYNAIQNHPALWAPLRRRGINYKGLLAYKKAFETIPSTRGNQLQTPKLKFPSCGEVVLDVLFWYYIWYVF
jgi:hypothetical protein